MKKRLTAVLLSLLMVITLQPVAAISTLADGEDPATVSITPDATTTTEASINIGVGETLIINVTNGSSSSSYDFTATLGNTGIVEMQSSATVTIASRGTDQFILAGLADGTVDVTIQNNGNYPRKGIVHVTVGAGGSEEPPVEPVTGDENVSITPDATNPPEESVALGIGETLVINVTNTSSSSGYDFTATLSKSDVVSLNAASVNIGAGATGQFVVTGLTDGTVDITIQNNNTYSNRRGIIQVTVGTGGSEEPPVEPPTGDVTVNITPDASNPPDESVTLGIGETLVINVTNSSTRSAYDFTATLSKSDVVSLNAASVNIAAGATGQFVVAGLTDGKVDITIQNNNSSSNRKGVIRVTVGTGGSDEPVDPPVTGDVTIDITPATGNPEVSVELAVDETLLINVTNGSSSQTYNYTATLENSGIAEIQGSSTKSIAASGTGQFLIKGLKDGKVDVVIQNDNTSSTRKGTIHVKVGNGGSEEPSGEPTTYKLATALEEGKEYLIANGKTGSVYVISNVTTGSGNNAGLAGISAEVVDGKITLSGSDAAKAAFTTELKTSPSGADSAWLKQGSNYLYTASSNGLRISTEQTSSSNSGKFWHYKADGKDLLWFYKDADGNDGYSDKGSTYRYYLKCDNGTFTSDHVDSNSLEDTDTPKMYIFVKDDGTTPEPVAVTRVSLDKTEAALEVGGTTTLTATVAPANADNKAVTWSSNAESVATVDASGKVTAVAEGTATITVTTADGGKTASCTVTVSKTEPPAETHYVETTALVDGADYLITMTKDDSSVYAMKVGTRTGSNNMTLVDPAVMTITPASGSAPAYIAASDANMVWNYTSSTQYFKSGSNYLYPTSSGDVAVYSSGRALNYADGKMSFESRSDGTFYITGSEGDFGTSNDINNAVTIRLFVEEEELPEIVAVTGVTVSETTLALNIGESETLTAAVAPANATNKNVTWSSSAESVATVDANGKVTAVAEGTATITVTTADGGKTATCTVTVSDPKIAVTGVTLNKTSLSLKVNGTETLTAAVAPENATNKNVTWSSSNNQVATVDANGKITAVASGTATITVTTEDGSKTATCAVTVSAVTSSVSELGKLSTSTIWLVTVKEDAGQAVTYKGEAMAWSSRYNAYVAAVAASSAPELSAADFAVSAGSAAEISYPTRVYDANGTGKVDMSDVQYIYNLNNGRYLNLSAAGGLEKVLAADINGDGKIDNTDLDAVMAEV